MEAFLNLFSLNWAVILIGIVVILVAFKFVWELIEWFLRKFNIETGSMREKRETKELLKNNSTQLETLASEAKTQAKKIEEDHNLIVKTSEELQALKQKEKTDIEKFKDNRVHDREQSLEIQEQLTTAINNINNSLTTIREENFNREISTLRWDILKFSVDISNGKKASREAYDFILKSHTRYEELLRLTGQENGLVNESVDFIRENYHQKLKNGEFK